MRCVKMIPKKDILNVDAAELRYFSLPATIPVPKIDKETDNTSKFKAAIINNLLNQSIRKIVSLSVAMATEIQSKRIVTSCVSIISRVFDMLLKRVYNKVVDRSQLSYMRTTHDVYVPSSNVHHLIGLLWKWTIRKWKHIGWKYVVGSLKINVHALLYILKISKNIKLLWNLLNATKYKNSFSWHKITIPAYIVFFCLVFLHCQGLLYRISVYRESLELFLFTIYTVYQEYIGLWNLRKFDKEHICLSFKEFEKTCWMRPYFLNRYISNCEMFAHFEVQFILALFVHFTNKIIKDWTRSTTQ